MYWPLSRYRFHHVFQLYLNGRQVSQHEWNQNCGQTRMQLGPARISPSNVYQITKFPKNLNAEDCKLLEEKAIYPINKWKQTACLENYSTRREMINCFKNVRRQLEIKCRLITTTTTTTTTTTNTTKTTTTTTTTTTKRRIVTTRKTTTEKNLREKELVTTKMPPTTIHADIRNDLVACDTCNIESFIEDVIIITEVNSGIFSTFSD